MPKNKKSTRGSYQSHETILRSSRQASDLAISTTSSSINPFTDIASRTISMTRILPSSCILYALQKPCEESETLVNRSTAAPRRANNKNWPLCYVLRMSKLRRYGRSRGMGKVVQSTGQRSVPNDYIDGTLPDQNIGLTRWWGPSILLAPRCHPKVRQSAKTIHTFRSDVRGL